MKKYAILILFCYMVLYHNFGNYWIFGYSIPGVISIAMDSNDWCVVFDGASRDCTIDERLLINKIKY